MECHYINLEKDVVKNDELRNLFKKNAPDNWVLKRFNAIDKKYVEDNNIQGLISNGAKGCYLSHLLLMSENINSRNPLLILEDDVIFSKNTFLIIEKLINSINDNIEWDLIHTDICVPTPGAMMDFYLQKKSMNKGQISLIDLSDKIYASTAAYIINHKSIAKIHRLLSEQYTLDIPIDIYLRKLTHNGLIKSFVSLPFITTLAKTSSESNIQLNEHAYTELIWHTYRKFIWLEADQDSVQSSIQKIMKSPIDKDARNLIALISGFFRKDYRNK